MKFLRIFGIFALILGFAFNGAFAATSSATGFGTEEAPVCDDTGCYYCDDENCYICDPETVPQSERGCSTFCANDTYGVPGSGTCASCATMHPNHTLSLQPTNRTANYCFKECGSTACTQLQDATWNSYFGGSNQADNFAIDLFVHDPKAPRLASFYPLASQNCSLGTDYCVYTVSCKTTTSACKPGHIQVNFYNSDGTSTIKTLYIVNRVAWSTQNTQFGDASTIGFYSDIIYPIFDTPTAPTISGKRFIGWYDAQTGGNIVFAPNAVLTYAKAQEVVALSGTAKSLYARYEDVAQPTWITITIDDKNNGTNPTTYSNPTVLYKNTNSAVSNCSGYKRTQSCAAASVTSITTPTLTGYTYGGHYTGTGGSGNQFINNSGVISTSYSPTSDITVFAKWTSDAYKISLNPTNAGSGVTYTIYYNNNRFYCDNAGTTQIDNGESIFTKCNFTKPTSNNGPFNGYWSERSGGVIYILEGGSFSTNLNSLNITGDMTWDAHYATCDSMIVLNPDGGNFSGTCANEFYPYYDSTTGQWMTPTLNTGCKPTLAGYTFMGYRVTNQNGVKYYNSNLNIDIPVWGLCSQPKVELVAEWTGNCNEITFDDNNGMTSVNANNPQHKRTGSPDWWGVNATPSDPCGKIYEGTNPTVNVPSNGNVPAHATFTGYYTTRDTGGSMIFNTSGAATTYGTNTWIISAPTTLYARWQCDTNYVWNANTHTCEQNTASVTYKCYVDDSGQIDNGVTLTNYAVRSLSWYSACNINANNPVPGYKWRFSGTNTDYNAGDIIPSWTYGNNQTFTPAYTATFNCNNDYWQTPTGGSAPAAQSVLLGGTLTMPNMPCEVKPEYDGWLETNYTWETSYTQNLTSPVPGAQCLISSSDLHYGPGNNFPWNCPTNLTFEPLTKFTNKPITVSCGLGGTSQTFIMTFENQNEIEQDIIDFFDNSCGGHCPLDNPSGPHGYNRKVVCAMGLENQNLPTTWEHIENDTQGRTCYKTPAGTNVQSILNEISLAQITDLNIYSISYCPQRVTYKCSEEATDVYNDAPYAVFEREYTTQTPEVVGCESGLAFNNWKNLNDNQTFNAGITVDEWPYEDPVTLVAQWGGANTYNITYANMANATGSQTGMPTTYTYGTGATIDGVPTREHSIFAGWCTESTLTNCAPSQTISTTDTGDKTFWAKWECVEPYHSNANGTACEACQDNMYWDGTQCQYCGQGDAAGFPRSTPPFNWSIDQCWRNCPNQAACQSATGLVFDSVCSITPIDSNATTQIEFKGNYEAGIQTCDATNVPYCPYGLDCSSENVNMPRSVQTKFWYGADLSNNTTRYVVGLGHWGANPGMNDGRIWSAIMGPAQQMSFSGPNDAYTFVMYPVQYAPDASVQGMTFTGYFDQRNDGTQYVGDNRLLNSANAHTVATVLDSQIPGDRNLYAHYDTNDYTVTYRCGTGTGADTTDTATYGTDYTVLNLGQTNCEKPGYSFLGWVFSGDSTMYNEGYVFRPWNYANDATFTAKWNDTGNTYTITYKPNYDGATEPDVTQSVTYGATFTTKPAGTFTRDGFRMIAWGGDPITQPVTPYPGLGETYTYNNTEDISLFAQWEPIDYTITYDCGTATGGTTPAQQTGIHYGDSVTPRANTCTKPGYNFQGWVVSNTADIKQSGVAFTWQYEEDKVFTAKWSDDPNTYVITYTPGYTGSGQSNVTQNITFGTQFQTQGRIFTRTGHIMTGWSEPFPLLSHNYQYSIEGNTTLDAQWQICPDGTQPNEMGTACVPCADNEAGVGGVCNPCPDGTQPNADHTACVPCADNEAGVGGVCNPCPDGTQPNADHTACEPCPEGEAGLGGICNPCPAGTQPNATGTACEPCPDGQYSVNGVCMPCPDGYQPNADHTACVPCADNEAGVGGVCNPCPDGTQPNAGHTACVPCPDETAGTNGTCEPCAPGYVPNAQATECEPCPAGTYWGNGICEPCPEDYSSVPGSVGLDACFLTDCPTGQHIAHGTCEDDVIICDAPYAETATRTWNPTLGAYGSCQIQECEDGYHVASNACVPNDQLCNVANGRGERAWNGTQWGNCVVTECDPGFEPNASNTACGRCGNYMGADGQPAVSSYIAGCEIATCMYQGQKYALENGECMPICNKPDDGTGHMEWNESTKKCVRTCNPGYKMW